MKTILIFDHAGSPGGSISRAVELAEKMNDFNFIFITFHSLKELKANTNKTHISAHTIKPFYSEKTAWKNRLWLTKKIQWKPYHLVATNAISLLLKIDNIFRLWQVLWAIGSRQVDLIQANNGPQDMLYILAKKINKPIIYYFRDLQNHQYFVGKKIDIAKKYIFVGENLMHMHKQQLDLPDHKCIMIRSPFDIEDRLKNTPNPDLFLINQLRAQGIKVLIMSARVTADKGQMIALEAIYLLHQKISNFALVIVGGVSSSSQDREYQEQLKQFVTEKKLTPLVHFLGYRDDVLHLIQKSDVAIHAATYYEAMAGGIVESLLLGVPTISSDIGGATEAIKHEVSGFLFTPGDYAGLANIIEKILSGDYDLNMISENGLKHANKNWNTVEIQTKMRTIYTTLSAPIAENSQHKQ